MTLEARQPLALLREPAIRRYMLVCLLALLVLLVVLLGKGLGEWSLLPVLLGLATLLLHAAWGPPVLLALLLLVFLAYHYGNDVSRIAFNLVSGRPVVLSVSDTGGWDIENLLLAAALLTFLLGFYRIQGLVHYIFPIDLRRKRWLREARLRGVRQADLTTPGETRPMACTEAEEVPWLVGLGLGWALATWLFWGVLSRWPPQAGFAQASWRGLVVFWLAALGLMLSTALLAYLRQATAGPTAARIYLQDQLWQQTRREQSRLNRWLVWARLKAQRRKEGT